MAITPVPYSQFLTQTSVLSTNSGPWHCSAFTNRGCGALNSWVTNNQTAILSVLLAEDAVDDYVMSLQADILLDSASFEGDKELSYSWSFFAIALSDQPSQRAPLLLLSGVNGFHYSDSLLVQDLANNETSTNSSYFLHTGSTAPLGVGTNRTISISLSLVVSHLRSELIGLRIRNLQLILGAPNSTSSTVASPTASSDAIASLPPTTPTTPPPTTSSPTAVPSTPGPAVDSWIIACSVASGVLLILLTILAIFLWKRRKRLRRISLSKVKNVKRPDPLLIDELPMDVIDITRHDSGLITPFYPSQAPHPTTQSKTPPALASPRRENRRRERHLNPPPAYLESPSSPLVTVGQVDAIPIRLTPQQRRSNRRISVL